PLLARPPLRWVRLTGLSAAALSVVGVLLYYVAPLAGRGLISFVQLLVGGCVWVVTSISVGVSMWDVTRSIARATLGSLLTLGGSLALSVLVVVGILSLYLLQRLLESEEESSS